MLQDLFLQWHPQVAVPAEQALHHPKVGKKRVPSHLPHAVLGARPHAELQHTLVPQLAVQYQMCLCSLLGVMWSVSKLLCYPVYSSVLWLHYTKAGAMSIQGKTEVVPPTVNHCKMGHTCTFPKIQLNELTAGDAH